MVFSLSLCPRQPQNKILPELFPEAPKISTYIVPALCRGDAGPNPRPDEMKFMDDTLKQLKAIEAELAKTAGKKAHFFMR